MRRGPDPSRSTRRAFFENWPTGTLSAGRQRRCSVYFLAHQPSPHWKSHIAHSDMHHPVSGINSQILSVSLASLSTHLLIHLSAHLYYHHHYHHPSLLHSFTLGSKPTFSTNPSHLRLLLSAGLPSWQWDWTGPIMLIVLFLVSHFNFLFVPCGGLS